MKRSILRSLVSRSEWRSDGVSLVFLIAIWFCFYPVAAQTPTTRRVTTLHADNDPQGSKVTVASDKALNDYEAYRRGDRFYVKVPAARLRGGKPNLRGKGFDDVTVQKAGSDVIFSFRLQPGTAAKVNQRTNGLDVVFSTPGGSQAGNTAQVPNIAGIQAPEPEASQQERQRDAATSGATAESAQATTSTPTHAADSAAQDSTGLESRGPNNEKVAGQRSDVSPTSLNDTATRAATANPVSSPNAQPPVAIAVDSQARTADSRHGVFEESRSARLTVLAVVLVLIGLAFLLVRRKRGEPRDLYGTIDPEDEPPAISPSAGINLELNKMLAGREYDREAIGVADSATRQLIEERLLTALSGPEVEQHQPARRAFLKYGYFADLVAQLRSASSPEERAIAAVKLGRVGDSQATSHLIEALNDKAPEVRRSVKESLRRLADPDLMATLSDLLSRESTRQLSSSLIKEAVQASVNRASGSEKLETITGDQPEILKVAAASAGKLHDSHPQTSPKNRDIA